MNREKILNTIGFCLIGVAFLFASARMIQTTLKRTDPNTERIIFAHWQLESGLREAFDKLVVEYQKLHPHVQITQLPVPERFYSNWLITKLVGEEAPDLIQLGFGINNDRTARFFVPLSEYVNEPNPYNAGTELEGVPWRNTFLDGLIGGFNPDLLEFYGVGLSLHTIRLFYNRDVFEEIRGANAEFPTNFSDFIKLCHEVEKHSALKGRGMVPIAGSQYNSGQFFFRLTGIMTQRTVFDLDYTNTFTTSSRILTQNYLRGKYGVGDAPVQASLAVTREIGRLMTPGFMSLRREDSSFAFTQQRAFCVLSGSWDIPTLKVLAEKFFRVGIANLPVPSRDDPVYGSYILGSVSEAGVNTGTNFGITRQSKNFERALDFLRFITSKNGCEIFSETSSWLPAVSGAKVPERINEFTPVLDGYVMGPVLTSIGADTKTAYDQLFYTIMQPEGGIEQFTRLMDERMRKSVPEDARRLNTTLIRTNQSMDVSFLANSWKAMKEECAISQKKAGIIGMGLVQSDFEILFYSETNKQRNPQK